MEKDMNMQDKELDALFSSRLDNLEVEPSRDLWSGIAAQLDTGKKKRSLLPYLSVAASIIVVISAGILFWPNSPKVEVKPAAKNQVAVKQTPTAVKPAELAVESNEIAEPVVNSKPVIEHIAKVPVKKTKPVVTKQLQQEAIINEEKPVITTQDEPVLAAVQSTPAVTNPVLPGNDVAITEKTISTEAEPFKTKPVVMASANISPAEKQDVQPVKKKKINSFGGLLNALVSKIDKRKDKVIEFSDGDENHITGINLGIIKIKGDNDK